MRNWIVLDYDFYHWIEKAIKGTGVNFEVSGNLPTPQAINLDAYANVIAEPLNKNLACDGSHVECAVYGIPAGVKWQTLYNHAALIDEGCHLLMYYNVLGTTSIWDVAKEVVACLCRYAEEGTG